MFEENPQQFNQYLNELQSAAAFARQGNSRDSELSLRNVAAVPPTVVVELSLAAMNNVFSSYPAQPQSEQDQLGPFLLLVAARLLHGGLARDWPTFWSVRLGQLRSIRSNLEDFLKKQAIHSAWLAPAVAEVAVAWAVLSKMIMLATNNNNNNNNNNQQLQQSTTIVHIPNEALSFLQDEWCSMISSVNENLSTAIVYCSLVRHSIEEFGLTAKISLGRGGLSLEQNDSLREKTFENVLPAAIFVVSEQIIILASKIKNNTYTENASDARNHMVNVLRKMVEILHCSLCWGPSVWSQEFGLDRIPEFLTLPPRKYRGCLFSTLGDLRNKGSIVPINDRNNDNLVVTEAAVAAFEVGLHLGRETDLSLPSIQCLIQLGSISMTAGGQAAPAKVNSPNYSSDNSTEFDDSMNNDNNMNENPPYWKAVEVARWTDEMFRALLSVCAYQIFQDYLPNPSMNMNNSNNSNNNSQVRDQLFKVEQQIEIGGSLLSAIAQAICRVFLNAVQKEVLLLGPSIEKFPEDVVAPFHKFSENLIRYHHELSVVIRKIFSGDTVGESMQVEEVFTEAIDFMLQGWRDFVRKAIDDVTCDAGLQGTPLREGIVRSAQSVFETFVNSRIRFVDEASSSSRNNNNSNNNSSSSKDTNKNKGGLVASSIQSRGMEYTLSQINTVGLLGRQDPVVTSQLLSSFLGPQVGGYLEELAKNPQGPAFSQTESIWYLFQIMSWLLTDDENSSLEVPAAINNAALAVENEAAREGAHRGDDIGFWKEIQRRIPIFGLVNGSFVFCKSLMEVVNSAPDDRKSIIISHINPLIITALLSFFRRFAHTYFFEDFERSKSNNGISQVFHVAFDLDPAATNNVLDFLNWSLCHFHNQQDAMKEAGELLYALASKPHIGSWLMNDRSRSSIVCAAAVGDDSGPMLRARLAGARRGALAGAVISACADDSMVESAMSFLKYYTQGFSSPVTPQNFSGIADTISSISCLLANARCQHHLGTLVDTAHPYLVEVVNCISNTPPPQQDHHLLSNLLEVFLNGIETCSFVLSTEVISWMLHSSVTIIDMVGNVVRYSVENVLPRLQNPQQREREEQSQLMLLKSSTALILCAAQWGSLNIVEFGQSGQSSSDERERVVGRLCCDGMLLVLREARHTNLIDVPELSSVVFRLVKEVAQTHTHFFLSVDQDSATVLLDATHWALSSADPVLVQHGFAVIEALTLAPESNQRMPRLLKRFLSICMQALMNGSAMEPSIQTPLSNAVFALGFALGRDELCDTFSETVANHPLLSKDGVGQNNRYVKIFAEAMFNEVNWGMDRKRRRMFAPILRRIMMVIRSANIFT